jgi:hypothetical protein
MRASGPGQSALLLLDVVSLLAAERIDYAVVGAMAASVHGVVRASVDADAVLSLAVTEIPELASKLRSGGFNPEIRRGDDGDPIAALLEVRDGHANRVDLIVGLRGMQPEAFRRAVDVPFEDAVLRVIGLEDFIAMKVFAGGPLDLSDARHAIAAAGESLDRALARRLAIGFGREARSELERLLAD